MPLDIREKNMSKGEKEDEEKDDEEKDDDSSHGSGSDGSSRKCMRMLHTIFQKII